MVVKNMNKEDIVKENKRFQQIINNQQFIHNEAFTIYYIDSNVTKFGISVSKKIGNAVTRNKIKRQIRNIVHKYKKLFPKDKEYIIMIRKGYGLRKFNEKESKLLSLIRKMELNK